MKAGKTTRNYFRVLSLFISIHLFALSSHAATVLHVDLDDMLAASEFVFEGRAVNFTTISTGNINETKTEVEFEILDIIKGSYPQPTIKLRFAGGTVNGTTLRIPGLHYPKPGETGVYFVETLSQDLVHPFYGWSQGHFLITEQDTVTTQGEVPVVDIVETRAPAASRDLTDGGGVARGVVIQESTSAGAGMTSTRFKDKLKSMLANP